MGSSFSSTDTHPQKNTGQQYVTTDYHLLKFNENMQQLFKTKFVYVTPATRFLSEENADKLNNHLESAFQRQITEAQWISEFKTIFPDKSSQRTLLNKAVMSWNRTADSKIATARSSQRNRPNEVDVSLDDTHLIWLLMMMVGCQRANITLNVLVRNQSSLAKLYILVPTFANKDFIQVIDEQTKQPITWYNNVKKDGPDVVDTVTNLLVMTTDREVDSYVNKLLQ